MKKLFFIIAFIKSLSLSSQNSINAELIYNTYFGGNEQDEARSITLDREGNFYLFGFTYSTDLPTSSSSYQDTLKGNYDTYISKFDSSGNLIWTTYLGGTNVDIASRIKTTNDNNLILIGYTNSNDFPTTTGAYQTNNAGQYDVFIVKMDTAGHIVWSTYFGGMGGELGIDLSIDLNNNIIIGGQTNSPNFPYTPGAFQPLPLGGNDAFVAKFNPQGQLIWSTCYGGTATEDIHAITSDYANNVIITGMTNSNDLSISSNAIQTVNNGFFDIYVAKFSPNGNFIWATYFGGTNYDDIYGIYCDSLNDIYLAGLTSSIDFYTTPNALQTTKNNGTDACIFKLKNDGNLVWSTYLGGDNNDAAERIYIDKNNNVITLINTTSDSSSLNSDTTFANAPLNIDKNYFSVLDTSGNYVWSFYYGGNSTDIAYDFTIAPAGKLFFCGTTQSSNLPTTTNAYQSNLQMYSDAYIAIISSELFYTDTSNIINSSGQYKNLISEILFYPNPANHYICISELGIFDKITVYNIHGQAISSFPLIGNCADIDYLPAGVYLMVVENKSEFFRNKIIKR